jgi:hypothetical protein
VKLVRTCVGGILLMRSIGFEIMRSKVKLELMGGIGNQLFIYAAGMWLSKKFGLEVSFDARSLSLEKVHGGLITDLNISGSVATLNGKWTMGRLVASLERAIRKQLSSIKSKFFSQLGSSTYIGGHDFDPSLIQKNHYKYVSAYFQTHQYSSELRSELQIEYQLKSESQWLTEMRTLARKRSILGLHIRRGDYLSLGDRFGLLSADYYRNAIETLRNHGFIWEEIWVFSDDIIGAKEMIQAVLAHENVSYIEPPEWSNPIESLMLFSEARLGVIANSTFSWWACFLSHNMNAVVAPATWFRSIPDPQELIPDYWFRIPSAWQG